MRMCDSHIREAQAPVGEVKQLLCSHGKKEKSHGWFMSCTCGLWWYLVVSP